MALSDNIPNYPKELNKVIELFKIQPIDKRKFVNIYTEIINKRVRKIFCYVLANLYSLNKDDLINDLTKYATLKPSVELTKKERTDLFIQLMGSATPYLENGISEFQEELLQTIDLCSKTPVEHWGDLPIN